MSDHEVVRAFAARLAKAATNGWDAERCQFEAKAFLAELSQRGWRLTPPDVNADWRTAPRAELNPARAHRNAETARRLLAEARATEERP